MIVIPDKYKKYMDDLNLKTLDEPTLFNSICYIKEGLDLVTFAEPVFQIAKEIVRANYRNDRERELIGRINELKNGDITFGEFQEPKELAEYLLTGV